MKSKDKYSCSCCSITPQNLKIMYSSNKIAYECPNHGKKNEKLTEYYKKQAKNTNLLLSNNSIRNTKAPEVKPKYLKIIREKTEFLENEKTKLEEQKEKIETGINMNQAVIAAYGSNIDKVDFASNIISVAKGIEEEEGAEEFDEEKFYGNSDNKKRILDVINKYFSLQAKITGDEIVLNLDSKDCDDNKIQLLKLVGFKNLEVLNLRNSGITKADEIAQLTLPKLKRLDLGFTAVNNLPNTNKFKLLEEINIESTKINNESIEINIDLYPNLKSIQSSKDQTISIGPTVKEKIRKIKKINKEIIEMTKSIPEEPDTNKFISNKIEDTFIDNESKEDNANVRKSNEGGMTLVYQFDPKKVRSIEIFSADFIKNNRNYCKMKVNGGKEEDLQQTLPVKPNKGEIRVTLIQKNKITDMKRMCSKCKFLKKIDNCECWDTSSVRTFDSMFFCCEHLVELNGINGWNTSNVEDMKYMFYKCSNLTKLDGIKKWAVNSVKNREKMFDECKKLPKEFYIFSQ